MVKQYALVDVKKYSIVATGTTQKDTLNAYKKLIKENGITTKTEGNLSEQYSHEKVTVQDIKYVNVTKGNVYKEKFSDDETLVFIQKSDIIDIYYEENQDTKIRSIEEWKLNENQQITKEGNK